MAQNQPQIRLSDGTIIPITPEMADDPDLLDEIVADATARIGSGNKTPADPMKTAAPATAPARRGFAGPLGGAFDPRRLIAPIPGVDEAAQWFANKVEGVDRPIQSAEPIEFGDSPGESGAPPVHPHLKTFNAVTAFGKGMYENLAQLPGVYSDVIELLHDPDINVRLATTRGLGAGAIETAGKTSPIDILTAKSFPKVVRAAKGVAGGAIGRITLKKMAEEARAARAASVPDMVAKSPTGEVKASVKAAPVINPSVMVGEKKMFDPVTGAQLTHARNQAADYIREGPEGAPMVGSGKLDPVTQIAGEAAEGAPPLTLLQRFEQMMQERAQGMRNFERLMGRAPEGTEGHSGGWDKASLPPVAEADLPPKVQKTRGIVLDPDYKPGGNIFTQSSPTEGRPELGMVREDPDFQITLKDGTVINRKDLHRIVQNEVNKGRMTRTEAESLLAQKVTPSRAPITSTATRPLFDRQGRLIRQGVESVPLEAVPTEQPSAVTVSHDPLTSKLGAGKRVPKAGTPTPIEDLIIHDPLAADIEIANRTNRAEPETLAPRNPDLEQLGLEMEAQNPNAVPGVMDKIMAEGMPGTTKPRLNLKDAANADLAEGYDDIIKALRGNKMSGIPVDPQLLVGVGKIVRGLVKRGYYEVNAAWREFSDLVGEGAAGARAAFDEAWKAETAGMIRPTVQRPGAMPKMPSLTPGKGEAKAKGPLMPGSKGPSGKTVMPTPAEAARMSPEGVAKIAAEREATQARLAAAKGDPEVAKSPAVRQEAVDNVTRPTERFDIAGNRIEEGTVFDSLNTNEQYAAKKLQNQIAPAVRAKIHAGEEPNPGWVGGKNSPMWNKVMQYKALYERAKAAGEAPPIPDTPAIATANKIDIGDRIDTSDPAVMARLDEDNIVLRAKQEMQLGQVTGELANEWKIRKARLKKIIEGNPTPEDRTLRGQLKGTTRLTGSGYRVFDPSVADAPGETVATGRPSRAKANRPPDNRPVIINDPFAEQMAASARPRPKTSELVTEGEEGLRAKNVSPADEPIRDIETEADRSANASYRESMREEALRKAGFTNDEIIQMEMGEIPDRVMDGSMPDEARALASDNINRVAESNAMWEKAAREAEMDRLEMGKEPNPNLEAEIAADAEARHLRDAEQEYQANRAAREARGPQTAVERAIAAKQAREAQPPSVVDKVADDIIGKIHEAMPETKPVPKTPEQVKAEAAPAPVAHPPTGMSQVDWSRMTIEEVAAKAEEAGAKLDPALRKALDEGGDVRAVTTLEQRKSAKFRDEVGEYTGLQSRVRAAERIAERNAALDAQARGNVEAAARAAGVEPPPAKSVVAESAKIAERIKHPEPQIIQPTAAESARAADEILSGEGYLETRGKADEAFDLGADRRIRQEIEEHAIDMEIEKRRAASVSGEAETLEIARLKHREAIVREKGRRKLEGKRIEDTAPEGVDPKIWRSNVAQALEVKYIFDKYGYWDERMINNLRRFYGAERTAKMMGLTGSQLDEAANLARELGGQSNIKGMKQTPMHAELTDLDTQANAAASRDNILKRLLKEDQGAVDVNLNEFKRLDEHISKRINYLLRDPQGFMRTEALLGASGALVGGAVGAAISGESLEDKVAGVISGAVLGMIAAEVGVNRLAGKRFTKEMAGEIISELDTANLLAGPAIIEASFGSIGGVAMGAAEEMLNGQRAQAMAGLEYMATGGVRDYVTTIKAPKGKLNQMSGRAGYTGQGSGHHAPSGTASEGALRTVTRPFVAADTVGMKALQRMGYTADEAERFLANGPPTSSLGQTILSEVNKQWWLRMLVKFPKVRIGSLERAIEYTPGMHLIGARGAHGAEQLTRGARRAKAIMGGAAITAGTAYGYFRDPGPIEAGAAASFAGPAFLPVAASIAAGKGFRKGLGGFTEAMAEVGDALPKISERDVRMLAFIKDGKPVVPERMKPLRPAKRAISAAREQLSK